MFSLFLYLVNMTDYDEYLYYENKEKVCVSWDVSCKDRNGNFVIKIAKFKPQNLIFQI